MFTDCDDRAACPPGRAGGGVGLLVSVRDAAEAADAVVGGVTVIDVKEPLRGPLGRPDAAVIRETVAVVGDRAPVSVALGELSDWSGRWPELTGVAIAKCGLSNQVDGDWSDRLHAFAAQRPPSIHVAPVAYADGQRAGCPRPETVLDVAARLGLEWLVIDTWDKTGPDSLAILGQQRVGRLLRQAARLGVRVTLAGGLRDAALDAAIALQPTLVGVRGAVCDGPREGAVVPRLVSALADRLRKTSGTTGAGVPY